MKERRGGKGESYTESVAPTATVAAAEVLPMRAQLGLLMLSFVPCIVFVLFCYYFLINCCSLPRLLQFVESPLFFVTLSHLHTAADT